MSDVQLIVNGRRYGGWKSVRIRRSIESIAGSFELDASDRWGGQDEIWPIFEEDECRVTIDGATVIDGHVDRRNLSLQADGRTLGYSGRDRTAVLVDCSALLDRWSFRDVTILDIARKVCAPFDIKVSVRPGLVLTQLKRKLVINPGETAFAVLESAAQASGVLLVSDGAGGLLITQAGTERVPTAIIEGANLLRGSAEFDASDRFSRYVVASQVAGTDNASGAVAGGVGAEAVDSGIRRTDRVLFIRPDKGLSTDFARRRADWEARVRAAKGDDISVAVRGWKQPNGQIWPLNKLVTVRASSIGVNGELLISETENSLDDSGGEVTELKLVRPDAFLPEPKAVVKGRRGWAELKDGAK